MEFVEITTAAQFKKHVLESDAPVLVYFRAP
jgi:hypothetical protein